MSERERARKRETREVERKREEASEKKGPSFFGVGTSKKKKNTPSLTIPSLPVPLSPSLPTPPQPILTPQEKNVDRFRQQLKALGFSYDWQREVSTTDPQYYKWTQWIFLKLFERGLAYQATVPVNWCPALGTVLANEEVVGGVSERGGHPVVRLPMKQWMLRITAYADRLLEGLDGLEWDENIKVRMRC